MSRKSDIQRFVIGRRILSLLLSTLFALLILYGYFVSASIVNVLVREEIEFDITIMSSDVGELESQYLKVKNEITLQYAYAQGFTDITKKGFTTRASLAGRGLTFNNQ